MEQKSNTEWKAAYRSNLAFVIIFVFFAFCVQLANAQSAANSTFRLIGTIESKLLSGAILQDTTGEQSLYQLYDKLPDGSQVVKVQSDSILLRGSDGTTYEIYITRETKSVATAQPYSTSDPFAEAMQKPPAERRLSAYEKRRQNRPGKRNSDDE